MTYCIGIKTQEGIVFASDSRTNAGLSDVNIYSKMYTHDVGDRSIIIVTSGNLATSQAVYKSIEKDLSNKTGKKNLNTCEDFDQIAKYIGELNIKHSSPKGMNTDTVILGSTFIVGGQIKGKPMELFLIYPQGNYIKPADSKPYLVIGEVKYGKPILDRVITPNVSIGDAARCALISMDSTLKSDLTVGPPIDFVVYKKDNYQIESQKCLNITDDEFLKVSKEWSEGILKIFDSFPRFEWEK
ncbi:20S proteasome subunit A/B [Candidatus Pelagibacter sp.]|nr:20S proteasome subunit A/B [Candidatus Pelagibacter sp.]|tara:strand:+ start:84 stop:809 length:726 start_codon:yes stop_codon:yes gene_type:complete